MTSAIDKAFEFKSDDIKELSTQNESLRKKQVLTIESV